MRRNEVGEMSWIGRVVNCYILTVILFLANNPLSATAQLNYVAKVSGPFVQQSETSQKRGRHLRWICWNLGNYDPVDTQDCPLDFTALELTESVR